MAFGARWGRNSWAFHVATSSFVAAYPQISSGRWDPMPTSLVLRQSRDSPGSPSCTALPGAQSQAIDSHPLDSKPGRAEGSSRQTCCPGKGLILSHRRARKGSSKAIYLNLASGSGPASFYGVTQTQECDNRSCAACRSPSPPPRFFLTARIWGVAAF